MRDGVVMANLQLGIQRARGTLFPGQIQYRNTGDLRTLLLQAYVATAESRTTSAQR